MDAPVVRTEVGKSIHGDNLFRGYRVLSELMGKAGFWDVLSLAVGFRLLSAEERALLDDMAVAVLASDPRIWLPKIARLTAACNGDVYRAICAGYAAMDGSNFGPGSMGPAATALAGLRQASDREAELDRRLALGERFHGFGVPFRDEDERVLAFEGRLKVYGRDRLPHWLLMREVEAILTARKKVRVNIGGALAAAMLDVGFSPVQVGHLGGVSVFGCFLANAFEESSLRSEALRRLPEECLNYCGTDAVQTKGPEEQP